MDNERMNKIIDGVYKNYKTKTEIMMGHGFHGGLLSQEEFINKCKTDSDFSETWGLRIEERELDMMERWELAELTPNMTEFDFANYMCDKFNVPTRLITITYNNETIEVYV
jgi:hypothetical protein